MPQYRYKARITDDITDAISETQEGCYKIKKLMLTRLYKIYH